ncbi:hypothetical protein HUA76_07655 [Myxococcus sp. CA056]|uniref:hypothetical protein n=1 Tax=Myxococcus sp. CA056 TaxID=2741740 RepID=UPI00157A2DEB|nr:hypothetical protein [Myxococcus sp. CA056]NTX10656.1 hypothetical protein [Myxococcus sp. CA056]
MTLSRIPARLRRLAPRWIAWLGLPLVIACASTRRYYLHSELPSLDGDTFLAVAPGPWPEVPTVLDTSAAVPDDLVLPTLQALMALPSSMDACDARTGRPRPDATEYCVAIYRTPDDWRVSWPIRDGGTSASACRPPFGGVDDVDFGRDLPIFGYAHNHPCGAEVSAKDLVVWPLAKSGEGLWVMMAYATTPSGRLARDARGQPVSTWGWLATGHRSAPRFYKWNPAGEVFLWDSARKKWSFQATCRPRPSSAIRPHGTPPDCSSAMSP